MNELSKNIIAISYIKNSYCVIDSNIKSESYSIDWVFEKNNLLLFVKLYNNEDELCYNKKHIDKYNKMINDYMLEKDIKSKFKFIVNSVDYFKNKKPKINTV